MFGLEIHIDSGEGDHEGDRWTSKVLAFSGRYWHLHRPQLFWNSASQPQKLIGCSFDS